MSSTEVRSEMVECAGNVGEEEAAEAPQFVVENIREMRVGESGVEYLVKWEGYER